MGERFIRSVLAQEESITASTVVTYDLPVNPLSFILITMRWQDGAALGNTADPIADLLSFIDRIDVLIGGASIYSMNGADSYYYSQFITRKIPQIVNLVDAATERHYLSWLIPMTRFPYARDEALPSMARGVSQLQMTYPAAVATVDTPAIILETVELLGANPVKHLKATTLSFTPSASGLNDVDLPLGNSLLGVLVFATTVPTGASTDRSVGQIRLLLDNVEMGYAATNWESFHAESIMMAPMNVAIDRHTHVMAANTDVVVGGQRLGIIGRNRYAFMDFDPLRDGSYMVPTNALKSAVLRIDSEGVTTAIRLVPVEMLQA